MLQNRSFMSKYAWAELNTIFAVLLNFQIIKFMCLFMGRRRQDSTKIHKIQNIGNEKLEKSYFIQFFSRITHSSTF